MTKGRVGVWNGPKKDDVIHEQPLIQYSCEHFNVTRVQVGARNVIIIMIVIIVIIISRKCRLVITNITFKVAMT